MPTDIWSIGVSLYTYLTQRVPFYAESDIEMQINAKRKDIEKLGDFSDEVNDIILKMLNKKSEERPTASELLQHPWLAE